MSHTAWECGLQDIVALADLISSTVKDVVEEYSAAGVSLPSLSSIIAGPFDRPEVMSPKLARATRILDAACAQLSFSVGSPGHVMTTKAYGSQEPACLLVATDARIADLLLNNPNGVHVDDLAKKTNIDAGKLGRVLRLLATKHCFAEIQPDVFVNNRLSLKLLSVDPVSDLVGHITDEVGKACTALNENLKDAETTASVSSHASAFKRAHGCTVFQFYGARFNRAMRGIGNVTGEGMLAKGYPWGLLPKDTIVCDVGGGKGQATLELLNAFPQLRIVVQDLPSVIEDGKEFLKNTFQMSCERKEHVQYVPLDFFNQSPVEACDVYYIRYVLHNWLAAECKQILDNIRQVAKPTSRLFIHEFVLQPIAADVASEGYFEKAPEPLLPNFGVGRVRQYAQDINMMICVNGQERTLAASGFEFVKLWDLGEVGLMEFVPMIPAESFKTL
ncbi:S-adenosyl-L-methionine-dependent methyltransferase [Mycena filopes]|nr:S-adenosyl-L-methionine-dependent methyltransferase [Mycena filopes]